MPGGGPCGRRHDAELDREITVVGIVIRRVPARVGTRFSLWELWDTDRGPQFLSPFQGWVLFFRVFPGLLTDEPLALSHMLANDDPFGTNSYGTKVPAASTCYGLSAFGRIVHRADLLPKASAWGYRLTGVGPVFRCAIPVGHERPGATRD